MKALRIGVLLACGLALGGCATATVVPIGNARPAIDPSQVRLYAQPPAHYEVVAILNGNSGIEGTGQNGVNDTIKKLKEQAAKLGANGVLLGKMGQQYSGSWGGASYLGWGAFSAASTASYSKTIDAQAIYVSDAQAGMAPGAPAGAWPSALPQYDVGAS